MQNISEKIRQTLLQEYGFEVCDIHKMTTGVGGDTFLINAHQGRFIYKIIDANEMNHPEEEPEICNFLFQRGLEVSNFLKNKSGNFVTQFDGKRVSHVQRYYLLSYYEVSFYSIGVIYELQECSFNFYLSHYSTMSTSKIQ